MEEEVRELELTMSNSLSKSFNFEEDDYNKEFPLKSFTEYNYKSAYEALKMAAEFALDIRAKHGNDAFGLAAIRIFNACEGWIEDECSLS